MTGPRDTAALALFERLADMAPHQRSAILQAPDLDPDLRSRVEAMLAMDAGDKGLLDTPAVAHLAGLSETPARAPLPERIGPYQVVDQLGQGGMATVYLANRADGEFEQTVALKLILPGHLDQAWRDRFLQERQLLASLHHPNIAQLLDGGVADDGSPYFALEYIDGEPITDYCDQRQLTLDQRLRLMLAVCDAVSYAHANLIVHRDLKPSNILVDSQGVTKLLDFGIAKLMTNQGAALTQTGQRALTPEYAAPEQFTGEAITTATDVYAMGVLLFELLLGRRPFVAETQSLVEIERRVLEEQPPTFSQLTAALDPAQRQAIAAARKSSWSRLKRGFSGDLENVVAQALRKEPLRRYPSVAALAEDLRRYLHSLPVRARADSRLYRVGKFIGRHRLGVTLGALAALGLMASTGIALYQAGAARLEAQKATETKEFLASLFEYASPDKSLGERLTARQLLDLGAIRVNQELDQQPRLRAELLQLLAETYVQLGLYDAAEPLAEQALAINRLPDLQLLAARIKRLKGEYPEAGQILSALSPPEDQALQSRILIERGELAREQADFVSARSHLDQALALDRSRQAPPADLARDLYRLATLLVSEGKNDQALATMEQASGLLTDAGAAGTTQFAAVRHDLGVLLIQAGDLDQARSVLNQVRDQRERLLGDRHPDLAVTLKELAGIARLQGSAEDAEGLYLRALFINEVMLGPDHPETANNLNSLAVFYRGQGDNERALEYAERALSSARVNYGDRHPTVGVMTMNVGNLQRTLGQPELAKKTVTEALEIVLATVGESHHLAGVVRNALADVQRALGETTAAEANFRQALAVFGAASGEQHPHMLNIHVGLANLLLDLERAKEAETQFRTAVSIGAAALPANHPNTSLAQIGLAHALAQTGQCEAADELMQAHLPIVAAAGMQTRPQIEAARAEVGQCGATPNAG